MSKKKINYFEDITDVIAFIIVLVTVLSFAVLIRTGTNNSIIKECTEYELRPFRYSGMFNAQVETTEQNADFHKKVCVKGILLSGKEYGR